MVDIDLAALQKRGFTLAIHIAEAVGIVYLVLQSEDGLGFTIEKSVVPLKNTTESAVWWLLFLLSGHDAVTQPLETLVAFQVLNDPALLSDRVFNELVSLMALCRSAKK